MLKWLKNFLKNEDTAANEEIVAQKSTTASMPIKENLILSEEIQQFLDANGPEATLTMLIGKLTQDLNGKDAAPIFSEYYSGNYSKKDVLDRYEELVQVDLDVLTGIKKLGDHLTPELASAAIGKTDEFCIYPAYFINEFVQCLAAGELTIKVANTKLWKFYFNYVKEFLDLAKKVGIQPEEYVPRDEIEATLIMLLKAERQREALK